MFLIAEKPTAKLEVYARTANGQAVEAFFHPVTLKKLLVLRRGKEIYCAPGFTG